MILKTKTPSGGRAIYDSRDLVVSMGQVEASMVSDENIRAEISSTTFNTLSISTVEGDAEFLNDFVLKQNIPNPCINSTIIEFMISKPGNCSLDIIDENRKRITLINFANLNSGLFRYQLNTRNFPTGTYFYKLIYDGKILTKQMDVQR